MKNKDLPEWARNMTDAEWEEQSKDHANFTNCATCGKRLILVLCKHSEKKNYCTDHCPKHKWQSDYDWQTECAKCGIPYTHYLQNLLEQHNIPFEIP